MAVDPAGQVAVPPPKLSAAIMNGPAAIVVIFVNPTGAGAGFAAGETGPVASLCEVVMPAERAQRLLNHGWIASDR